MNRDGRLSYFDLGILKDTGWFKQLTIDWYVLK